MVLIEEQIADGVRPIYYSAQRGRTVLQFTAKLTEEAPHWQAKPHAGTLAGHNLLRMNERSV